MVVVTATIHQEFVYLSPISRLNAHAVQAGKVAGPSERVQRSHRSSAEPREPPGSRQVQPDANQPRNDHLWLEPGPLELGLWLG